MSNGDEYVYVAFTNHEKARMSLAQGSPKQVFAQCRECQILLPAIPSQKSPNRLARMGAPRMAEPIAFGPSRWSGDDLDDITVTKDIVQRHDATIHKCTVAPVANLRMYRVGEVNHTGPARKALDVFVRGKDYDSVMERIQLTVFY